MGSEGQSCSEQDTPPGNARRTQNSNNQVIERSFSAALSVHSAVLTALGQLPLHRLFPRGLEGKCHENMVIDLSKDEPRATHREGVREILKTSSFIFPEKEGKDFQTRLFCVRKVVLPACQGGNPFQDCIFLASGLTMKCQGC